MPQVGASASPGQRSTQFSEPARQRLGQRLALQEVSFGRVGLSVASARGSISERQQRPTFEAGSGDAFARDDNVSALPSASRGARGGLARPWLAASQLDEVVQPPQLELPRANPSLVSSDLSPGPDSRRYGK